VSLYPTLPGVASPFSLVEPVPVGPPFHVPLDTRAAAIEDGVAAELTTPVWMGRGLMAITCTIARTTDGKRTCHLLNRSGSSSVLTRYDEIL